MVKSNRELCKIINYDFHNYSILEKALTHSSVCKKNIENDIMNFQRLEFLGDSVLNMIISIMLFKQFPTENEGLLTKRKNYLISEATIAHIARSLKLEDFVTIEEKCSDKILEDVLEALIGAIYIDGGINNAKLIIHRYWSNLFHSSICTKNDPKTTLQEWTQKNKLPLPRYKIVDKVGPSHRSRFTVSCDILVCYIYNINFIYL